MKAQASYIALSYWDVAASALFLALAAVLTLVLRLGLFRSLLLVALRMVAQLLAIGFVLKMIFQASSGLVTLAAALVMSGFAAREVINRQQRTLAGLWRYGVGPLAMLFTGAIALVYAMTLLLQPEPWYAPRYALPLFGMILGNSMNGVSLGLNAITRTIVRDRLAIEARLLLGMTRWRAFRPFAADALRTGMTPIMNAMAASGVISLPGMMTGQILAGVPPVEAVKYQLLIMFLIAGVVGLGTMVAVFATIARLTDHRHRLRPDRLREPD
ncbi:iron export ABC transporter permease subunit FetB [Thermopetrobacter sp. TC1]|uniref:ABC transporter permease n=1 Tax=Thermopetrobacter sp. TC1 TaxID=1495045 RepID=UPI000571031E|nr:iron export ABC transporter permease subunit FetB [Thermopetrobacter sp. TC1]